MKRILLLILLSLTQVVFAQVNIELETRIKIFNEVIQSTNEVRVTVSKEKAEALLQVKDLNATLELLPTREWKLNSTLLRLAEYKTESQKMDYIVRVLAMSKAAAITIFPAAEAAESDGGRITLADYILRKDKEIANRWVELGLLRRDISGPKWKAFRDLDPEKGKNIREVRLFCGINPDDFPSYSYAFEKKRGNLCENSSKAHRVVIFYDGGETSERRAVPMKADGKCYFENFIINYRVAESTGRLERVKDSIEDSNALLNCCEKTPDCVEEVSNFIRQKESARVRESAIDRGIKSVK